MNTIPNIALVGTPQPGKEGLLNTVLAEEDLGDVCTVTLYGADGQQETEALRNAVNDYRNGRINGIVCLPMALSPKKALREAMSEEASAFVAVYDNDAIKMTSVKGDSNANDVAASLTSGDLKEKALQTANALKRDFMILNPRVAVLSLNQEISADETSAEISIIAPTVSELVKRGTQVFGPLPYTAFFEGNGYMAYDAVVEMYDRQCMEAFTKASSQEAITVASNLSVPMVFAQPESVLKAIFAVIDIARNRKEYDAPFVNPLPKLYHERKEDGDKARFAVKKKGFNPAEHRRENVPYPVTKTEKNDEGNATNADVQQAKVAESPQ